VQDKLQLDSVQLNPTVDISLWWACIGDLNPQFPCHPINVDCAAPTQKSYLPVNGVLGLLIFLIMIKPKFQDAQRGDCLVTPLPETTIIKFSGSLLLLNHLFPIQLWTAHEAPHFLLQQVLNLQKVLLR
jgi:hypothetical protein